MTLLPLLLLLNASPRLLESEVAVKVGLLGTGYTVAGSRLGDAHATASLEARFLISGFTIEAGVLGVLPFSFETTGANATGALAIGWSGETWSLTVGAVVQRAALATPALQWLPQVRASKYFGDVGLTLGVFDHLGLVPAHLSANLKFGDSRFSMGWVAPIGLITGFRFAQWEHVSIDVHAFAYRLFNSEYAMISVGGSFR